MDCSANLQQLTKKFFRAGCTGLKFQPKQGHHCRMVGAIRETSSPVRTYVATGFMHVVCSSTDPFSAILRRAISASRHAGCFHHQQKCQ